MSLMYDSVYALIDDIRMRPSMWIPDRSVVKLGFFLHGFLTARRPEDLVEDQPPPFRFFDEWLASRMGWTRALCWFDSLVDKMGDGPAAFDRFLELADQFRELRPRVVARLVIPQEPRPHPGPLEVHLIEFRPDPFYCFREVTRNGHVCHPAPADSLYANLVSVAARLKVRSAQWVLQE